MQILLAYAESQFPNDWIKFYTEALLFLNNYDKYFHAANSQCAGISPASISFSVVSNNFVLSFAQEHFNSLFPSAYLIDSVAIFHEHYHSSIHHNDLEPQETLTEITFSVGNPHHEPSVYLSVRV